MAWVFFRIALPVYSPDYMSKVEIKSYAFFSRLGLFSPLNVLILQNYPSIDSSVFVPSLYELNFKCMNWHILCEYSDGCLNYPVITNKLKSLRNSKARNKCFIYQLLAFG